MVLSPRNLDKLTNLLHYNGMGGRVDVELNSYIFYFQTLILFFLLSGYRFLFVEFFGAFERALGKTKLSNLFQREQRGNVHIVGWCRLQFSLRNFIFYFFFMILRSRTRVLCTPDRVCAEQLKDIFRPPPPSSLLPSLFFLLPSFPYLSPCLSETWPYCIIQAGLEPNPNPNPPASA